MLRRVWLTLSAVSLLVFAALIALCIRSQFAGDWIQIHSNDPQANTWKAWDIVGGRSGIYISYQRFEFENPGAALAYAQALKRVNGVGHVATRTQTNPFAGGTSMWNIIGFGFQSGPMRGDSSSQGIYRYRFPFAHVPYWFLMLMTLIGGWPVISAMLARRRRAGL